MRQTRRLAAILAADVVGYSPRIGQDGASTRLSRANRSENSRSPRAEVQMMGDGVLIKFDSVVDALRCASEPGLVMEAPDGLVAGDKAVLRWSYPLPRSRRIRARSWG
jgi:adenylate cyclase